MSSKNGCLLFSSISFPFSPSSSITSHGSRRWRRNAATQRPLFRCTKSQRLKAISHQPPVDSTAKAFLPFRSQACWYRLSTGGRDTRAIIDLRDSNLLFSMMGDCFHLFHSFALCPHGTRGHCAADRGPDSDHTPLKTLLFFTWRS